MIKKQQLFLDNYTFSNMTIILFKHSNSCSYISGINTNIIVCVVNGLLL